VILALNDENLAKFVDCAKSANPKPVLPIPIDSLREPRNRTTATGNRGAQEALRLVR